jgi:hypothetical protein
MGVRTFEGPSDLYERKALSAGPVAAALVVLASFVLLVSNGRPIGAPDAHGLLGFLARPVTAALQRVVELDETALALAGKVTSALFAALAAGFLFAAMARRQPTGEAGTAAFLFALGSSLFAASQSLSSEAPAAAAVALAVLFLVRGEGEPRWMELAGLPLGLAIALVPWTAGLTLVIALGLVAKGPLRALLFLAWSLPGFLWLASQGPPSGAWPTLAAPGLSALVPFVSPARGAFVFTPLALVALFGLLRALRRDHRFETSRWLPATLGLAFLAHGALVALVPDETRSWGSLVMTAAWPLVFVFLPEGFAATGKAGGLVALLSVSVQALGAFAYDGRWDRLYRDATGRVVAPWNLAESPIPFQVRERVVHLAMPGLADQGRRVVVREHLVVLREAEGSRITFAGTPLVTGSDATLRDVALLGGAHGVNLQELELREPGDGVFLRVREGSRPRRLQLRIAGRGQGTLVVSEGSFWKPLPRVVAQTVGGDFQVRQPYHYPDAGGPDLRITLRSGRVSLRAISLVPPNEPENVIRLQGVPGN